MHTLLPVPESIVDSSGKPRFGSYRGSLPSIDITSLGRGPVFRLFHHKRWMYTAIASEDVLIAVAVVDLGYASNAFALALDARSMRVIADTSSLGPPFAASVSAEPGRDASYKLPGASLRVERPSGSTALSVDVCMRDVEIRARLETKGAPPAIAAIAPIVGGVVNMTEKRALLGVTGSAVIAGRRVSLDGALGGYDYTNGLLARRTQWRWGFALGRARSGERVALNVTQGFVGEAECAAWIDGDLYPLAEARFTFDANSPLSPWRVVTADSAVDLTFRPGGMHADTRDYGVIASRFMQVAGVYSGKLAIEGRGEIQLDSVLGVTEDQDMLW